jgi:hypothetical protein
MHLRNCRALITGASAGLGEEFARQLAAHAELLVLVARRADRLEKLRDELVAAHPKLQVTIFPADLSRADEIEKLVAALQREALVIDLLINNAGLGDLGAFATADPERLDQMMLVNMVGLTRLTRALLPAMIERRRGHVLNVSSSASFLPIANFAVYAATKAYVTSLSEALRGELRGSGVGVTALCPGPVRTEFTEVARRSSGNEPELGPKFVYVSAREAVGAALHGVERDRAIVIPGWAMKAGMTIVRLTPRAVLRFASRFSAKPAA